MVCASSTMRINLELLSVWPPAPFWLSFIKTPFSRRFSSGAAILYRGAKNRFASFAASFPAFLAAHGSAGSWPRWPMPFLANPGASPPPGPIKAFWAAIVNRLFLFFLFLAPKARFGRRPATFSARSRRLLLGKPWTAWLAPCAEPPKGAGRGASRKGGELEWKKRSFCLVRVFLRGFSVAAYCFLLLICKNNFDCSRPFGRPLLQNPRS